MQQTTPSSRHRPAIVCPTQPDSHLSSFSHSLNQRSSSTPPRPSSSSYPEAARRDPLLTVAYSLPHVEPANSTTPPSCPPAIGNRVVTGILSWQLGTNRVWGTWS